MKLDRLRVRAVKPDRCRIVPQASSRIVPSSRIVAQAPSRIVPSSRIVVRASSLLVAAAIMLLIRAYQLAIRPMLSGACKFHPTCSEYAVDAIRLHGPWFGAWLAAKRLARCRPLSQGGYDPCPHGPASDRGARPLADIARRPGGSNNHSYESRGHRRDP